MKTGANCCNVTFTASIKDPSGAGEFGAHFPKGTCWRTVPPLMRHPNRDYWCETGAVVPTHNKEIIIKHVVEPRVGMLRFQAIPDQLEFDRGN